MFRDGLVDFARLAELVHVVGVSRLVLDLSCRKRPRRSPEAASEAASEAAFEYVVVTDRWQRFTDVIVSADTLVTLSVRPLSRAPFPRLFISIATAFRALCLSFSGLLCRVSRARRRRRRSATGRRCRSRRSVECSLSSKYLSLSVCPLILLSSYPLVLLSSLYLSFTVRSFNPSKFCSMA